MNSPPIIMIAMPPITSPTIIPTDTFEEEVVVAGVVVGVGVGRGPPVTSDGSSS